MLPEPVSVMESSSTPRMLDQQRGEPKYTKDDMAD